MGAEGGVPFLVEFMNPKENIMGYVLKDIYYLLFINFGFEHFTFLCDSVVSSLILILAYKLV